MSTLNFKSEKKAAKQARWVAEPTIILKPLRFIKHRSTTHSVDPKTGQRLTHYGVLYHMARDFADAGEGTAVSLMARYLDAGK